MVRLIKKYKNRRLYDTETSQCITINELQRYVVDGIPFRVQDTASGMDLTNATLVQMIVEMQLTAASPLLSSDVLRQFIIMAQHPLSQTYKTMLEQFITAFKHHSPSPLDPLAREGHNLVDDWGTQVQQMMNEWLTMKK